MQVMMIKGGRIPRVGEFAPGDSPDVPPKVAGDLIRAGYAVSTDRNDVSPPPTVTIEVDDDLVILSEDEIGGL